MARSEHTARELPPSPRPAGTASARAAEGRHESAGRAAAALALLLTAAPIAVLAGLVWRFHVDVPQWDQWRFPDLLASFEAGHLTLADLAAQHNEHRILFPRLLVLGLASASRWNTSLELAANLLLALALFGVLARETERRTPPRGLGGVRWLVALESLLVFSLTQWENWLWGMEMAIFLAALAVAAGMASLANRSVGFTRLACAAAAGVVATYSFANGLLYWPIGAGVLAALPGRRRGALPTWIAISGVVVASYLYGYETPAHTAPFSLLQKPVKHLGYALSYLGAPVVYVDRPGSQLAGAVGLAWVGLALWRLRRARSLRPALAFYGALAAFAAASAAITAVGRIEISGPGSSLTSRYITFGNFLWLAAVGLAGLAGVAGGAPRRRGRAAERAVATALLIALGIGAVGSSAAAAPWFRRQWDKLAPARAALIGADPASVPDDVLLRVCWSPQLVREGLVKLRENRLWIYATEAR